MLYLFFVLCKHRLEYTLDDSVERFFIFFKRRLKFWKELRHMEIFKWYRQLPCKLWLVILVVHIDSCISNITQEIHRWLVFSPLRQCKNLQWLHDALPILHAGNDFVQCLRKDGFSIFFWCIFCLLGEGNGTVNTCGLLVSKLPRFHVVHCQKRFYELRRAFFSVLRHFIGNETNRRK